MMFPCVLQGVVAAKGEGPKLQVIVVVAEFLQAFDCLLPSYGIGMVAQ